jgi:CspA family cold shock protein|tara:strand:+ start:103 stop:294 length:192 start_codon:yes stop_codon:yes gene_type:complete
MKGTVKFFNSQKHFGFISGEDEKDYFVHSSQILDNAVLDENDEVEFSGEEGDRGLVAKEVKKL